LVAQRKERKEPEVDVTVDARTREVCESQRVRAIGID
jgi:hypothetical protein